LTRNGETIDARTWNWGIRPLAVRGGRLVYLGRNWTLRAARIQNSLTDVEAIETYRAAEMACVTAPPSEEVCEFASQRGILLVVEWTDREPTLDELYRYGRWPAVGMFILPGAWSTGDECRAAARNVIFAARLPA